MMKLVSGLLAILLFPGCSENPQTDKPRAETAAASAVTQPSARAHSLVFFLDPNGAPCQMQDRILRGMSAELQEIDLRYVRTTVPSDIDTFYAFGIRGLPALLVTDASGKELRRLPPGVKSEEEIRTLLRSVQ